MLFLEGRAHGKLCNEEPRLLHLGGQILPNKRDFSYCFGGN